MSAASDKLRHEASSRATLDATATALSSLAGADFGFVTIAQQLPLKIVVLDPDLRVRWLNRVAAASLGTDESMVVGRYWPEIARGPTDRFEIYSRVLAGEPVDVRDIELQRSGEVLHVDGLCRPLRNPTGAVVGILIVGQDVTARRATERALAESERSFRLLAERTRDIVAVISPSGQMQYVNRAIELVLGFRPDEIVGTNSMDLVHPDDVPELAVRLAALAVHDARRRDSPLEYRVRHKDGSWRWIESLPAVVSDGPLGYSVLTASRDVTGRRRAEDALRLSEERYRLAIRAMNGVIHDWNTSSGQLLRTPGLGDWLGMTEDELPGQIDAWHACIHPEDRPSIADILSRLQRHGQIESSYRVRCASGDYARLWERSILVCDALGHPERVIGFIVNRTEASRTQTLLEATEQTALIGGWEQNFRTGRMHWTDQVFRLYDIDPNPLVPVTQGTSCYFAPSARPVIGAAIDAARIHGTPFDIETKMVSAAGRIWWARIVAHVERDADGQSVRAYGAIQDITERKQAEIELRTKSQWLEVALSASKMSAWRLDLVSGAIHTAARSADMPQMVIPPTTLDSLYAVMHPDDRPLVAAALETARRSAGTFAVEYRTLMTDGAWAWKSSVGRVETDERGQALALIGATQDITDRRAAELALRDSERTLRQVTQHSTDSLTLVDSSLRISFTNRSVQGLSAQQMEGRPLADFLPADRVAHVLDCLRRVLVTGRPDSYSLEYANRIDGLRHYEFRVSPVTDRGQVTGLVINGSDVTAHILAERAIATQARMIDSMLEGVAVVNAANRIEITNPAFDCMFGYPRGALIGIEMAALSNAHDEGDPLGNTDETEAALHTASRPLEFEAQRRDGSVFAVAGIVTRFDVAGRDHRLVVLQDVSERKALEREILEAGSREQQRIGADLHDGLGQELTGIALMMRSVASRLAGEYPALLPEVEGITRLLSNAVESTRSLARGLSPVTLERRGLIDALEGLAMQAREAYRIEVGFHQRVRRSVELDQGLADHLYRIAQEALSNAMRHGGASAVEIRLTTRGARIRLQVADDGRGLPRGAIDAPGLGLKIMRYRARMVGGEVRFEKNGRRGTRVICDCPLLLRAGTLVPRAGATRRATRKPPVATAAERTDS